MLGLTSAGHSPAAAQGPEKPAPLTYEQQMGCRYGPVPADPTAAPTLTEVPIPKFPGSWAIWGATGRDRRGHIWFGVCSHKAKTPSARLFEYDPASRALTDRGDVVTALQKAGVYRPREQQMKIHTKILHAADGHLYFASMDEDGENSDGSKLPTWGGHLWRYRLDTKEWQHLLATKEALIAAGGDGARVFSLGYFNHALYRYDLATGKSTNVMVRAEGGHVSRNFLVDDRGHAYVPRLVKTRLGHLVALVELDPDLKEVGATPLRYYTITHDDDSHGIVAFQPLADRSIAFATDQGYLYRVTPPKGGGKAKVEELGWFHPRGKTYVGSMFTYDGERHLVGAGQQGTGYQWVVFDLKTRLSRATPLVIPKVKGQAPRNLLLYGSVTRDDDGCFYLAGTHTGAGRGEPILLQARPPR
jgi:hypothetical protein